MNRLTVDNSIFLLFVSGILFFGSAFECVGSSSQESLFTRPKVVVVSRVYGAQGFGLTRIKCILKSAGVPYVLCGYKADLSGYKLAIFPSQQKISEQGVKNIEKYIQDGGKAIFFLNAPSPLSHDLLRVDLKKVLKGKKSHLEDMYFSKKAHDLFKSIPEHVVLDHWTGDGGMNVRLPLAHVEPKEGCNIIATWCDKEGKDSSYPAVTLSENGILVTKPLFFRVDEDTTKIMMSFIGHFVPEIWEEATKNVLAAGAGDFSYYHTLDEVEKLIQERPSKGKNVKQAEKSLKAAKSFVRKSLKVKDPVKSYILARKAKQASEDAYCFLFASKKGELRDVWTSTRGIDGWQKTMSAVKENGFNAIHIMSDLSLHFFSTKGSVTSPWDPTLKEFIKYGNKYGIDVHATAGIYRVGKMKPQINMAGEKGALWAICPTPEINRRVTKQAMLSIAEKYDLDGMNWDEFGYRRGSCYCEYCRNKFEKDKNIVIKEYAY